MFPEESTFAFARSANDDPAITVAVVMLFTLISQLPILKRGFRMRKVTL